MHIVRAKDKDEALNKAAQALSELFEEQYRKPTLFLSAGGSSLGILQFVDPMHLGSHLCIGVTDERYSENPEINNFAKLMATPLYGEARNRDAEFIDTRIKDGESLESLAERFEKSLRNWKTAHPEGRVLITQGIGPDGHTQGILPYQENPDLFKKLFDNPERWAVGYDAEDKNEFPLRLTVTMPFLRDVVDFAIVYMVGENKKEALRGILAEQGNLVQTPGRIIREMKNVTVFTDIIV